MKHHWIRRLLVILAVAAITACTSTPEIPTETELWTTYPSQFIVGDTYILKAHEKIKGNVVGIGTTLVIEEGAIVMGDISLVGSNLAVSGRIAGDVNVLAGTSLIEDTAIIAGNINQIFQKMEIDPKALVTGEINTYTFPVKGSNNTGSQITKLLDLLHPEKILALQIIPVLGLVLLALIGIYALKSPTRKVSNAIRANAPAAWGAGLLSLFSGPIIAVILVITICLSPAGILLLITLAICNLWGWVALSVILGENIINWLKLDWQIEPATIIGALFLGIASALISFIPCVGFLLNLMISATGIGGVLLSRFGSIHK